MIILLPLLFLKELVVNPFKGMCCANDEKKKKALKKPKQQTNFSTQIHTYKINSSIKESGERRGACVPSAPRSGMARVRADGQGQERLAVSLQGWETGWA